MVHQQRQILQHARPARACGSETPPAGSKDRSGKPRLGPAAASGRWVAAMMRTSTLTVSLSPTRCSSPHLHKAQQLRLQGQRHLADLVQKQRSPVGGLDPAHAALHRAGKCAARVAEQFGFEQRFRNRRAVDGDKRLAAARATAGAALRPPAPCPSRSAPQSAPASSAAPPGARAG